MKYFLGLDIGITSVGWGVIDKNNNIIKCGVRLFDEADQKTMLIAEPSEVQED